MGVVMGIRRRRSMGVVAVVALLLGAWGVYAPPASATLGILARPTFPAAAVVGQTITASFTIVDESLPPDQGPMAVSLIDLYPACDFFALDCENGLGLEPGVFALSATATGATPPPEVAGCAGNWTITPDTGDATTASRFRFVPPGGDGSLIIAFGQTCTVTFTALVRRVPTVDVLTVNVPGVQTAQVTSLTVAGQRAGAPSSETISQATPGLSTRASSIPAQAVDPPAVPATATDTATLAAPPPPSSGNGAPPTGSINFSLFGPNDPDCSRDPAATRSVTVNGFGAYPTTPPATVSAGGAYAWQAAYTGDASYASATTACGGAGETLTFKAAALTIADCATITPERAAALGYNVITGTDASETLIGTAGKDAIFGFGGQDIIYGLGGDDILVGGDGNDQLFGGDGNEILCGGPGNDYLDGGPGNDGLAGEAGNDALLGGPGDDTLAGGPGFDRIDGGTGTNSNDGGPDLDYCVNGANVNCP